jgi:hypothetical protein
LPALAALADRRLADSYLVRAAGLYGWGIAMSYAVGMLLDPSATLALLASAVVTLAWVPGAVIAFAAARDAGGATESSGIALLARQRGFDHRALAWARFVGTASRISRAVGVRAVLLALFAASRGSGPVAAGAAPLRWVSGALRWSRVAGLGVAGLARAAAWLLPERGRFLLVAVLLLPLAAALAWPGTVTLVDVVSGLVPTLLGSGAT